MERYFALLVFIPFLSLLNKDRLPWAVSGVVTGYGLVLMIGTCQSQIDGEQGVLFGISYRLFVNARNRRHLSIYLGEGSVK